MRKVVRIIICFTFSLFLLNLFNLDAAAEGPNSKTFVLDETHPFSTGVVENRRFNTDEPDLYRFTIPDSGQVTIITEGKHFKTRICLHDNYDNELFPNDGGGATYTVDESETVIKTFSLNKGSYYFSIGDDSWPYAWQGDAKYRIQSISFARSTETFKEEQDGTNNDTLYTANVISPGMDVKAMLATGEKADYYKLNLPKSGRIRFVVQSADIKTYTFTLLSQNSTEILKRELNRPSGVANTTFNETLDLVAGTYYICIENEHANMGRGYYTFNNTFNPANESEDIKESDIALNDSVDTAQTIQLANEYYAQLALNEEKDVYEFALTAKGTMHVYFNGDMQNVSVEILNASGNTSWSKSNSLSSGVNVIDVDTDTEFDIGTYYLRINKSYDATGNYKFKLTSNAKKLLDQQNNDLTDSKGSVYKITSSTTATFVRPKDKNQKSVSVPATVTLNKKVYKVSAIDKNAFKDNKNLTKVTIGKNVSTIGVSAFQGAIKLKKLDLSKASVTVINKNAFKNCKTLASIKINGNKVKTIKSGSFKTGSSKIEITVLAKNQKTYNSVASKVTKAGASKKACKFKKSAK